MRVVMGEFRGGTGPVDDIAADPQNLDISIPSGVKKRFRINTCLRAFAYASGDIAAFADASQPIERFMKNEFSRQEVNIRDIFRNRTMVRFKAGDDVTVQAGPNDVRILLNSGAPINKPVA